MAENTQQTGFTLGGGNKDQNKYLDYYSQLSTKLTEQPYKIGYTPVNVQEQTYQGLADQISAYLRPYADTAIRQRRAQTKSDRASADVDAASRGMSEGSTWLSDAKNRMSAAEAADIAGIENNYLSSLMNQVYGSYQDYLNRKYNADVLNAQNQLDVDKFNAQLYETLEQRAWERAKQMYDMRSKGGSGTSGGSVTFIPTTTTPTSKSVPSIPTRVTPISR